MPEPFESVSFASAAPPLPRRETPHPNNIKLMMNSGANEQRVFCGGHRSLKTGGGERVEVCEHEKESHRMRRGEDEH